MDQKRYSESRLNAILRSWLEQFTKAYIRIIWSASSNFHLARCQREVRRTWKTRSICRLLTTLTTRNGARGSRSPRSEWRQIELADRESFSIRVKALDGHRIDRPLDRPGPTADEPWTDLIFGLSSDWPWMAPVWPRKRTDRGLTDGQTEWQTEKDGRTESLIAGCAKSSTKVRMNREFDWWLGSRLFVHMVMECIKRLYLTILFFFTFVFYLTW